MGKVQISAQCTHGDLDGTVSFDRAVEITGLERKRLAGLIVRNYVSQNDPRGCRVCGQVHLDSMPTPVHGSAAP